MGEKKALIPNMFTMTNMVIGFIAILIAGKGTPEALAQAGVMIFIASFFDLIDGAAARGLKVDNPIGGELDSLADAISYGIAPGVIAYYSYLRQSEYGILVAVIFPLCAIYRLARFNLGAEKGEFSGLPSPPAGILISSIPALPAFLPFIGKMPEITPLPIKLFMGIYVLSALLMVSHVDYKKIFSDIWSKGKTARITAIVIVALLLIFFQMWAVFIVTSFYVLVGLVYYVTHLTRQSQLKEG